MRQIRKYYVKGKMENISIKIECWIVFGNKLWVRNKILILIADKYIYICKIK